MGRNKKNKGVTPSSEEGSRPSLGVPKRGKGVRKRPYHHHKQARLKPRDMAASAHGFIRRAVPLFSSCFKPTPNSALVTGSESNVADCVALDCEFVGTGLKGKVSMLGRCSVVNHHGNVLYDTYVAPLAPVTDYRTPWSGIRKFNLEGAPSFMVVQSKVMELLKGRMLVGHDLREDLRVLDIAHPIHMIRDTSRYTFNPFQRNTKNERSKLKSLLKGLTGVEIQNGEHCSVEDAQAAMLLYQHSKVSWEQSLTQNVNSN